MITLDRSAASGQDITSTSRFRYPSTQSSHILGALLSPCKAPSWIIPQSLLFYQLPNIVTHLQHALITSSRLIGSLRIRQATLNASLAIYVRYYRFAFAKLTVDVANLGRTGFSGSADHQKCIPPPSPSCPTAARRWHNGACWIQCASECRKQNQTPCSPGTTNEWDFYAIQVLAFPINVYQEASERKTAFTPGQRTIHNRVDRSAHKPRATGNFVANIRSAFEEQRGS